MLRNAESKTGGQVGGGRNRTALDTATLQAMGAKGREFVAAEFGREQVARQFVCMYEGVLASASTSSKQPSSNLAAMSDR